MRSSGWFSNNILGRSYGRDNTEFEEKPNAIIVLSSRIGDKLDKVKDLCDKEEVYTVVVPELSSQDLSSIVTKVKRNLKETYIKKWGNQRYREGLEKGIYNINFTTLFIYNFYLLRILPF